MSRVRVYELAKEAGMSSKALADKLMDEGYDIKGHSSTVDDDTAAKIRNEVLQKSETKLVEKRIGGGSEGAPTVIRRRSTVIRRKKEDLAPEPEGTAVEATPEVKAEVTGKADIDAVKTALTAEKEKAAEPVAAKQETAPSEEKKKVAEPEKETPVQEKVEVEPVVESRPVPDKAEEEKPASPAEKVETVHFEKKDVPAPKAESQERKPKQERPANHGQRIDQKKGGQKEQKRPQPRKGMAKVVGTIELPIESTDSGPSRPKKKPNRPSTARRGGPVVEQGLDTLYKDDSANKAAARKKGKKGAAADDDKDSRRGSKGIKKGGGKNVKFTHFGNDYQRTGGKRGKRGKRQQERVTQQPAPEMKAIKKRITVYETITVSELAARMRVKAGEVIGKLMSLGVMATINQAVDVDTAMLIATEFGYEVEQGITEEIGIQMLDEAQQEGGEAIPRSPVVTVMGHVDHGKTSILDAIRKTDVADGEAGGITQHIGAYHVTSAAGDVTFVDTPGHAAFTEMRSRGAQITDLVVLVVAADDGVMDQTREAIRHSQAAGVPILVAVNKIDKDNADPDRVKRELAELNLAPEEWGGDTMFVETSAKQRYGIDDLLEAIQLMAEMLELKADPERKAKGRVVEAQLHKGRGAVATILVQEGTLRTGDYFVVGQHSGKVRAMLDYRGRSIKEAGPSIPVEVQGLAGVPQAGDEFIVVTDEKMAKSVSQARSQKAREVELGANSKISLDKLFEKMSEGEVQELRVVIRSDVQGTLEAFAKAAEELSTKEIKVRVLHEGTGTITESDILLASASEAIIIGFNVRPTLKVKELATKENVDVRSYDVIYHALDDIRKAMVGMLEPTYEEEVIGTAEVRDTFGVPKVGTIAGSFVSDGKIQRNAGVRVLREGVVVYTGKISSLKRFKDDAKEVLTGYECGIGVENFNDIKIGDQLEAFIMQEVEATLSSNDKDGEEK